ncbi:MAG: hypothetical protein J5762_00750 [Clostridia bacterium]|nr:hypothetical protein [Clostridia bacterium]
MNEKDDISKLHIKKMIAPIVVTVIMIAYFIVYFAVLIFLTESLVFKILLAVIPATFGTVMIIVCVQRIKEIKGGEEDDLGKY